MASNLGLLQTQSPLNFTSNTNDTDTKTVGGYGVIDTNTNNLKSLFGKHSFTPFPGSPNESGYPDNNKYNNRNTDENNDTSISSIINFTKQKGNSALALDYAYFAYLKNLGVYPNNRLIIARRFASPVGNDLIAMGANGRDSNNPLSTLISWMPEGEDLLDINFGEVWDSAQSSFSTLLNSIGKDMTLSSDNASGMSNLGGAAGSAMNAVPLPGLTEAIQRKMIVKLGLAKDDKSAILPVGDPNLIKQAKQRHIVGKDEAGSGLKCDFKIKMSVEYEQKYIDGIDPTLVYMDIIANALSFGTSNARFLFNSNFATKTSSLIKDLISGDLSAVGRVLTIVVKQFAEVVIGYAKQLKDALKGFVNKATKVATAATEAEKTAADDSLKKAAQKAIDTAFKFSVGAVIGKYKVALLGVVNALTGSPSGYWHVTIGNPKRPVFSSGDMIVEDVQLKLGPILSWNDLPSSIKIDFTLSNARALGADEIYARFNSSMARNYTRDPDVNQANDATLGITSDEVEKKPVEKTPNGPAPLAPAQTNAFPNRPGYPGYNPNLPNS